MLAFGISNPISTMVVQIRPSNSPPIKSFIICLISFFFNLPCAIPTLYSGITLSISFFNDSIFPISFCKIKDWPPLSFSRLKASLISCVVWSFKNDLILILLEGAVCKNEKSFNPEKTIFIVLGIGVADKYKICKFSCLSFMKFFCLMPNLCSSSIINRPTLEKSKLLLKAIWVVINISIFLFLKSSIIFCFSLVPVCLLSLVTDTGKFSNLFKKELLCWSQRTVLGVTMTTCLFEKTEI